MEQADLNGTLPEDDFCHSFLKAVPCDGPCAVEGVEAVSRVVRRAARPFK